MKRIARLLFGHVSFLLKPAGLCCINYFSHRFLLCKWTQDNDSLRTLRSSLLIIAWSCGRDLFLQYSSLGTIGTPVAFPQKQKLSGLLRYKSSIVPIFSRLITLVWAYLMTLSVLVSVIRRIPLVHFPGWVYFDVTICIILTGLTYTTVFKRQKLLQRERAQKET